MSWGSPVIWTGTSFSNGVGQFVQDGGYFSHLILHFSAACMWILLQKLSLDNMMEQRLQTYSVSPGLTDLSCYFRSKNRWWLNCFGGEIGISSYIILPYWYFTSGILLVLRNWVHMRLLNQMDHQKQCQGVETCWRQYFYQLRSPGLHLSKNWVVSR